MGTLIGPGIGAFLYYLGGYTAPFFIIGFVYSIIVLYAIYDSLTRTNKVNELTQELVNDVQSDSKIILSFWDIITVKRSFFAHLANIMVFYSLAYTLTLLSTHWYEVGFTAESMGGIITLTSISFAV